MSGSHGNNFHGLSPEFILPANIWKNIYRYRCIYIQYKYVFTSVCVCVCAPKELTLPQNEVFGLTVTGRNWRMMTDLQTERMHKMENTDTVSLHNGMEQVLVWVHSGMEQVLVRVHNGTEQVQVPVLI